MGNIEIEYRAIITAEKHQELNDFLLQNAEDLGEDSKEDHFFLFPEKYFKVVKNVSKNTAKIALKLGRIGMEKDYLEEYEIAIAVEDYENAVNMFKKMLDCQIIKSFQERHNFSYKGVEIAVKYSNNWKHHVELEISVEDISEKEEADKKIFAVANELVLKILTQEEQKVITDKIESENR